MHPYGADLFQTKVFPRIVSHSDFLSVSGSPISVAAQTFWPYEELSVNEDVEEAASDSPTLPFWPMPHDAPCPKMPQDASPPVTSQQSFQHVPQGALYFTPPKDHTILFCTVLAPCCCTHLDKRTWVADMDHPLGSTNLFFGTLYPNSELWQTMIFMALPSLTFSSQ